jgi:hypothetical protein
MMVASESAQRTLGRRVLDAPLRHFIGHQLHNIRMHDPALLGTNTPTPIRTRRICDATER